MNWKLVVSPANAYAVKRALAGWLLILRIPAIETMDLY
jgi:hypothetical protein